jgi:CRISPR-associated protein (TIGR03985 family)
MTAPANYFTYPPSPEVLQWLSEGQFYNRIGRSLRLWLWLRYFYGGAKAWWSNLPKPFTYPQVRDRLFASTHPTDDRLSVEDLVQLCGDGRCLCHRTVRQLVFAPDTGQQEAAWIAKVRHLTGLSAEELDECLQQQPFATVHRSLRDDLKQLVRLGWLQKGSRGRYRCVSLSELPSFPDEEEKTGVGVEPEPLRQLIPLLESIAFVQPNVELVARSLWERLVSDSPSPSPTESPQKRVFLHLDYILPPSVQDRVDTYQEQLERLWRGSGGVVQFDYWTQQGRRRVEIVAYPVCLHYVRRAKYLSACGVDPNGEFGWHNYRLDRVASPQLRVLAWGDGGVPSRLKELRRQGALPTPEDVEAALSEAWGFDFYREKALLIMRFPAEFARWYVDNTERHPTFEPVAYAALPQLVVQEVRSQQQRRQILDLIAARSPLDAYYRAWIRVGDINLTMRLRDWRPKGEVLAPPIVRYWMAQEVEAERANYRGEL